MKITEIERETIPVMRWSEENVNLAEQAATVLGYKRLQTEKTAPQSPLAATLAQLQIEVLKTSSVKAYQLERLKERATEMFNAWLSTITLEGVGSTSFNTPSWRRHEISEYHDPIPEFVLNKAIDIKKNFPEAVIQIEALEDYPDPFLIVATKKKGYSYVNDEEIYVEAWAEPKFEGTL